MIWPAFDALYQNTFNKNTATVGWGLMGAFDKIGTGLGAYIGAHIAYQFNFHLLFFIMVCIALITLVLTVIFLPNNIGTSTNQA